MLDLPANTAATVATTRTARSTIPSTPSWGPCLLLISTDLRTIPRKNQPDVGSLSLISQSLFLSLPTTASARTTTVARPTWRYGESELANAALAKRLMLILLCTHCAKTLLQPLLLLSCCHYYTEKLLFLLLYVHVLYCYTTYTCMPCCIKHRCHNFAPRPDTFVSNKVTDELVSIAAHPIPVNSLMYVHAHPLPPPPANSPKEPDCCSSASTAHGNSSVFSREFLLLKEHTNGCYSHYIRTLPILQT